MDGSELPVQRTKLIRRLGTMTILAGVAPASAAMTFASESARARNSSSEMSAGAAKRVRSLPLI